MKLATCTFTMTLIVCLFNAGCGSGGTEFDQVKGTITFAGQPIVFGEVEFIPDSSKGHEGPAGIAPIVNGKFDTSENGQGLAYGPHIVKVTAYESEPAPAPADETVEVEAIPPLFVGYPVEMEVKTPELTIDLPEEARGHNLDSGGN